MNDGGPFPAAPRHDFTRAIAEISIAAVSILYATGFLATFTFLERFGIRETGSEFLRLKYIYVGILYFLFPITIMLPCFALWSLWKQARKDKRRRFSTTAVKLPFASIVLVLNMLLVFYVFICFAPVTFIHRRPWVVAAVSIPTILGALFLRFLSERRLRRRLVNIPVIGKIFWRLLNKSRETRRRFRSRSSSEMMFRMWRRIVTFWHWLGGGQMILFLLIATIIDRPALRGLWADLNLMFWGDSDKVIWAIKKIRLTLPIGGFNYFLFVFLYFVVGERVLRRIGQHPSQIRTKYLAGGAGVFFSLFVVSILSFAIRVYPFVPALKGGGDYRKSAATLTLKTKREFHLTIPEKAIIIEETPASLFIALPEQAQTTIGQTSARPATKGPREGNWRLWKDLPRVLEIPREAVASVEYKPPGQWKLNK